MSKPTYIKDKKGKFAGSIGAGKTTVPTAAPSIHPAAPAPIPDVALTEIPAPGMVTAVPSYCLDAHIEDMQDLRAPMGRPDLTTRESWPVPSTQHDLEEKFLHGPFGLFASLIHPPRELSHHEDLHALHADAVVRSKELRAAGLHHQAAAVEWTSATARGIYHDLYDIHEDIVWTADNEGVSFGAGDDVSIMIRDTDHRIALIADSAGVAVIDPNRDSPVDREHSYAIDDPDFVIPVDVLRSHAREMFTGAVIMDHLHLTAGDPEAAAVWGSLTN